MSKNQLGIILALNKLCEKALKEATKQIREMSDEEVEELQKGGHIAIKRDISNPPIYSEEYKEEKKRLEEELKAKYPPKYEPKENYKITMTATPLSKSQAEIIFNDLTALTKGSLQKIQKAASTIKPTKKK